MTLTLNGKKITVNKAQEIFGIKRLDYMIRETYKIRSICADHNEQTWTDIEDTYNLIIKI